MTPKRSSAGPWPGRRAVPLILAQVMLLGAASQMLPRGESVFRSRRYGFSVRYPRSWRHPSEGGTFQIFNFPRSEAVRGAVLPEGGAGINVVVPEEMAPTYAARGKPLPKTPEEWVALQAGTYGYRVVRKGPFEASGKHWRLSGIEVVGVSGVGGDSRESVDWFFVVGSRMFLTSAYYWRGNPNAAQLKEVLKQVALSVRPTPENQ